jgi:D-beta-D-heptose 7-phosphate kinase/D-beta-D-heptose 1-phosphate adenosyltransferase
LRPINTQEDRAQVLAALSCVDHIVAFDSNTPHDLIRIVKPDVFAKGGDYTRETLPEAPLVESLGGEVVILPYLEDRSTTSIIERIRTQGPAALSRLENRK